MSLTAAISSADTLLIILLQYSISVELSKEYIFIRDGILPLRDIIFSIQSSPLTKTYFIAASLKINSISLILVVG